ncbi:histone-lysine N-methyltransferase SETMAR [Elysia marginata]|uniref:Histone-lysine N-methyltransferase SETMAR n=1 Tax=Elysia marginata TaxID=1093978 RepID=A0AAV4JJ66_9GAST|nr:histone-lysine N-methyltransferase SETMAR [Elysia marginata]
MATSNDRLIKKHSLIQFMAAEVCSAANIHARIKTVYGEMCISECKSQSMEYRHKTSSSKRKFNVDATARKALFAIFWDMKGVVHIQFLEQGQIVNSERYISTLRALKLRLRRNRRNKDSILQHGNVRPHTSRQTQDAATYRTLDTDPILSPHLQLIFVSPTQEVSLPEGPFL